MTILLNDKHPFFSVIIPVYNKEKYVARAIESVLKQTFSKFELIIVCDPSTDNSNAEVEKFNDPRIKIFYRDIPGPGGYAARNLGIKNSKGQWITFLDADDFYFKEHLQYMFDLHMEYPDVLFLTCAKQGVKHGKLFLDSFSKNTNKKVKCLDAKDFIKYCLENKNPVNTNSATISKNWTTDTKWFPDGLVERSGDLYLWVKIAVITNKIVWGCHIGSQTHKDVIGVSKTNVPSILFNHQMVEELKNYTDRETIIELKKYANKLMITAWFERKKNGYKDAPLKSFLFFGNDFMSLLFWVSLSYLNKDILYRIQSFKRKLWKSKL